jgi:hypothetical protein
MKGFKMCCISSAVDGTGDDMLWNDTEEAGDVRNECVEDESTDCADGDSDTDW